MSNRGGITIITEFVDVTRYLFGYLEQIALQEYGYENSRLKQMPNVYDSLLKWEARNLEVLSANEKNEFYALKERLEKVMDELQISSPEVIIK